MMNFSTSSLFGMFALASSTTPGNSSLVSAETVLNSLDRNNNDDLRKFTLGQPVLDPLGGNLRMWGLVDPSEPLTLAETSFLEATIQETFNALHEEMGIDLLAHSVAIASETFGKFAGTSNVSANTNNGDEYVGSNKETRSLLRGNRQLPWNDQEMCTYQRGPNKGESIPGCTFDIDFYMDCYCHLCRDDDFIWDGNKITNPTKPPTLKPTRAPTAHPVAPPTVVGCNMCRDDDFVFDGNNIYKPTRAPTKKEEENITIDLEEERGPDQPFIFLPPPSQTPAGPPRPSNININPIENDVLKKLRKSKLKRFHKLKRLQFRGWP